MRPGYVEFVLTYRLGKSTKRTDTYLTDFHDQLLNFPVEIFVNSD